MDPIPKACWWKDNRNYRIDPHQAQLMNIENLKPRQYHSLSVWKNLPLSVPRSTLGNPNKSCPLRFETPIPASSMPQIKVKTASGSALFNYTRSTPASA